jgi:hypothetical protein
MKYYNAIVKLLCITIFFVVVGMSFRGTLKEGFEGSLLEYNMSDGIENGLDTTKYTTNHPLYWSIHDHDSSLSKNVNPDQNLYFYAKTEFKPSCCYTLDPTEIDTGKLNKNAIRTSGCKCMTVGQLKTLSSRGGNHIHLVEDEDYIS